MNKNLLKYLFKSKKTAITFIFVVFILVYSMIYTLIDIEKTYIVALGVITAIAYILSVVLVPITFGFVHNKKAVDSYFSLPISRKEQLITTQVFCDLVILIPVIVLTFVSLFINVFFGENVYVFSYLLYLVLMIIGIIVITMFNTATFLLANSTFDGIVMIFAYLLIPALLTIAIEVFASSYIYGFESLKSEKFMSLISIVYASIIGLGQSCEGMFYGEIEYRDIIFFLICISWHFVASIIILKNNFILRKVERAETISNRFASYPFIIYFYIFTLLFIFIALNSESHLASYVISFVLIFICFEIANCVYKRKIKIEIKDICFFMLSVGVALLIGYVANKTNGFGIAYRYEKNPINVTYEFSTSNMDTDDNELDNLIIKKYPTMFDYHVYGDVNIASKDMAKSKEVIDFFENKRIELIDKHYNDIKEYPTIERYGHLAVRNNRDEDKNGDIIEDIYSYKQLNYIYSYRNIDVFSVEDLMFIDKYGDVRIDISTGDNFYEIRLAELLKE